MKKALLLFMLLSTIAFSSVIAQQRQVSGKVTNATGEGVPGVSVFVKGSTTGTITDVNGSYTINVEPGATLVFQSVGLVSQEIIVQNQSTVDVQMAEDVKVLKEVVVTGALGIERQKETLGYAVQNIDGKELSQKATPDVFGALQGKVAGLTVIQSSGIPGASTTIQLRGKTSITGNNQALIVVDGMPINNSTTTLGTEPTVFGSQYANRGADLNPEDIESINVLKGPSAAALYGSRAANGAIIITTKKAKENGGKKFQGSYSSNVQFNVVNFLPKWQNEYGQGLSGRHHSPVSSNSWGRRFGAVANDSITNFQGNRESYRAYPDNVRDFYETAVSYTNNLQLSTSQDKSSFILSLGHTLQNGTVPDTQFERVNVRIAGSAEITKGLTIGGNFQYFISTQDGVPQGNTSSSPWFLLNSIPRSYDLQGIPFENADGSQNFYSTVDHPLWSIRNNPYNSETNRYLATFNVGYEVIEGLRVDWRLGIDSYTSERKQVFAKNSARFGDGQITDDFVFSRNIESYLNVTYNKQFGDFNLRLLAGNNVLESSLRNSYIVGSDIAIPGFNDIANTSIQTPTDNVVSQRRIIGVYGEAELTYKNLATLTLTGRNDWSSTLPEGARSFFYPSATLAFIFSELIPQNNILSYGKLRLNFSRVGNDAPPFRLQSVFTVPSFGNNVAGLAFPFNGNPGFTTGNTIGNPALTPEFTNSFEIGTELNFWDDRIGLDVTFYDQKTEDQIQTVVLPASTGFINQTTNIGTVRNRGVELVLNGRPVSVAGFEWNVIVNWTAYTNKVEDLGPGVDQLNFGGGFTGYGAGAVVGENLGVFISTGFARDPETGKLLIASTNNTGTTGLLIPGPSGAVVGDPTPDWYGSLINQFTYQNDRLGTFNFGIQFDMKKGGDIASTTIGFMRGLGAIEETAVERERPRLLEGLLSDVSGNLILDDQGQPIENNILVTAQDYWRQFGTFSGATVFDASFIRLREITFSYALPQTIISKIPFGTVEVNFAARNIWTYAPNVRHINPEGNADGASVNRTGFEYNSPPGQASYAAGLRLTF